MRKGLQEGEDAEARCVGFLYKYMFSMWPAWTSRISRKESVETQHQVPGECETYL